MREDDPLVCHCCTVAESEIVEAIREGADSIETIGQACEAGTGCQSCHGLLRALLQQDARLELARSRAPRSLRQLSLFDELVEDGTRRRNTAPMGSHKR